MDRRGVGYHVFPSKDFVSHSTEKFPRGTLVFQKCYGVEFFLIIGVPRFCRFFLSHTAENFRRGAFLSFTKWCPKNQWTKGGEGESHFSVKNFWSNFRKISYGNPLVCHYFRVSKNFMLKRVMSRFSVENFLSQRTEKLRNGTLLCFRNILV